MSSNPSRPDYELTPLGYHEFLPLKQKIDAEINGIRRFVPIKERTQTGVFKVDALQDLSHGKFLTEWKGVPLMKSAIDIQLYQALFWDIKPKTIFELGSFQGGSAMWMADNVAMFGIKCHVYTVDIDPSLIDPRSKNSQNVTFIEGDCNDIEKALPQKLLAESPHPWVVIEDAHINVNGTLEYFHKHMQSGDYLITDDTNPDTSMSSGGGLTSEYQRIGDKKLNIVRDFLVKHGDDYAIDTKFTDMFGYNGTWNMNGYIRRM